MTSEMQICINPSSLILFDNKFTIFMSKNPFVTPHLRHIRIAYNVIREFGNKGALRNEYIPTKMQHADGFRVKARFSEHQLSISSGSGTSLCTARQDLHGIYLVQDRWISDYQSCS